MFSLAFLLLGSEFSPSGQDYYLWRIVLLYPIFEQQCIERAFAFGASTSAMSGSLIAGIRVSARWVLLLISHTRTSCIQVVLCNGGRWHRGTLSQQHFIQSRMGAVPWNVFGTSARKTKRSLYEPQRAPLLVATVCIPLGWVACARDLEEIETRNHRYLAVYVCTWCPRSRELASGHGSTRGSDYPLIKGWLSTGHAAEESILKNTITKIFKHRRMYKHRQRTPRMCYKKATEVIRMYLAVANDTGRQRGQARTFHTFALARKPAIFAAARRPNRVNLYTDMRYARNLVSVVNPARFISRVDIRPNSNKVANKKDLFNHI